MRPRPDPSRRRRRPAGPARRLATLALAAVLAAGAAGPAAAQRPPAVPGASAAPRIPGAGAAVRAVATFDPATGERTRELLTPLTPMERRTVERALVRQGLLAPGAADGVLDDRTAAALRRLQEREGLEACGCANLATARALGIPVRTVTTVLARSGDGGPDRGGGERVEVLYPGGPPAPGPGAADAGPAGEEAASGAGAGRDPARSRGAFHVPGVLPVPILIPGALSGAPLAPGVFSPFAPAAGAADAGAVPAGRPDGVGRLPARPLPSPRVSPPSPPRVTPSPSTGPPPR